MHQIVKSVAAGPHHTLSLPPELMGVPGGPAPQSRPGQGLQQRPARPQQPLVATQSVPASSRLQAVSQSPLFDPTRLTVSNLGAQDQQQQQQSQISGFLNSDRLAGSQALRRFSHVRPEHAVLCDHSSLSFMLDRFSRLSYVCTESCRYAKQQKSCHGSANLLTIADTLSHAQQMSKQAHAVEYPF